MPAKTAKNQPTFEQALSRLEEIVDSLETGDATLDEAMALYEEGTRLRRACAERLETATEKIRVLTEDTKGTDAEEDEAD
ncbi:MAG: exodeoxyribonuclease VII small subunit [Armatimonadia bacterium]|nr:exodeoxyribonuclease VII small subunit [Armatimonadia bacterium]